MRKEKDTVVIVVGDDIHYKVDYIEFLFDWCQQTFFFSFDLRVEHKCIDVLFLA